MLFPRSAGRVCCLGSSVPFSPLTDWVVGGTRIVASIADDNSVVSGCFEPGKPLRITAGLPVIASIPSQECVWH